MAAFTGKTWTVIRTLPRVGDFYLVRVGGVSELRRADRNFLRDTRRVFVPAQPAS